MSKKKRRVRAGPPPNAAAPKVHVQVALADTDLGAGCRLIKPALLYADRVALYSPAAWMMSAVTELANIRGPRQQVLAMLAIVEEVPQLASQLDVPSETLDQVRGFLGVDRRLLRRIGAMHGARGQVDELYARLDELSAIWSDRMPETIVKVKDSLGADELLLAVNAKAVTVASLSDLPNSDVVADVLRQATGSPSGPAIHDVIVAFAARMVEMLTNDRGFPLFDAQSSGLVRALEAAASAAPSPNAMRRGAEISSAASFMGYLPYFPDLPMDEVLDPQEVAGYGTGRITLRSCTRHRGVEAQR